ncbi:hypothetical protein DXG03_002387 [Asterophora parasitica]|uniref:3-beta hydroxysteroid dehydrogenase/isomerase domain-containing protein n=1 Tax=Asterophora parasitica TaxID=117018 RepID=A0A9P7G5S4_9AGAR|nr:hypothetical protein DXG03_002387 [Asterophora parasitica]
MAAILYAVILLLFFAVYVPLNNYRLTRLPKEAAAFSPVRWTPESVREDAAKLAQKLPITINDQLPPKTGRRYIVVGGVLATFYSSSLKLLTKRVFSIQAGFLGGWIVCSLLERGESPSHIRILDIRPPVRDDLNAALEQGVSFIQVDVSDLAAVDAAFTAPWPSISSSPSSDSKPELTVYHTAANIRFYERHPVFLSRSARVNFTGTQNVVNASRKAGATVLVYTSSGSVGVRSSRFFLWPWEKEPNHFLQIIGDDDSMLPKRHEDFFSNYAVSKLKAEVLVRGADRSATGDGNGDKVLRTGCIRPGNGVFGPRGDILCGAYLVRRSNPTWTGNILQSFCYVENCALAHLCYEERLIALLDSSSKKLPDIGGQAFIIADPGPPPTYGDAYTALTTLSKGECTFPSLHPTPMLILATLIERYSLLQFFSSSGAWGSLGKVVGSFLPPVTGDLVNLQPSLFALTSVHLVMDDSRARKSPQEGGLGYVGKWTTLQGIVKTVDEHRKELSLDREREGRGEGGRKGRSEMAGISFDWRKSKRAK